MSVDKYSKLFGEQSKATLVDKNRELAEVRELYEKVKTLGSEISQLKSTIQTVQKDSLSVDNTINNFISNSSFLYSHRVYSMATYYNSRYILAKWYGRSSYSVNSWQINTDSTESVHSVRSAYGYPYTLQELAWLFPGTPISELNDWRFSNTNLLTIVVNSSNPQNETLSVSVAGFTPTVGATIRLRGENINVPIASTLYGLRVDSTYWISSVASSGPGTYNITLSEAELPQSPAVPVNVKVSGTGTVYGYPYVEPRPGVGWEVESGTLCMSGGYTAAAHLVEKKLRLADNLYLQLQVSFIPKLLVLEVDVHTQIFRNFKHGLIDGTRVMLISTENKPPTGLEQARIYYTSDCQRDTFKLKNEDGSYAVYTDSGAGTLMLRTAMAPDLTLSASVWDNAKNRIFRGDRPKLSVNKIGTHLPDNDGLAVKEMSGGTYFAGPLFNSDDSKIQPFYEKFQIFDKSRVYLKPFPGNSLPDPFLENTEYIIGKQLNDTAYFLSDISGNTITPTTLSNGDPVNFTVVQFLYDYSPLVTRRYVLEVATQDDRKVYSEYRIFDENQNQMSNTRDVSTVDSQNSVVVSWEAVPKARAYSIYRSVGDGDFKLLGTVTDTATQFIDYGGDLGKILGITKEKTSGKTYGGRVRDLGYLVNPPRGSYETTHILQNGDRIEITFSYVQNLPVGTVAYVVNASPNTFGLSLTKDGPPIRFTVIPVYQNAGRQLNYVKYVDPSGYDEFQTAEVRIADITKDIWNSPAVSSKFVANLSFPSIISDFEYSGEQFLQLELLRADGTKATLADAPLYSFCIDEIGLSYLAGDWSPSSRDMSMKPLPIIPRNVIPKVPRGDRQEILVDNTVYLPSGIWVDSLSPVIFFANQVLASQFITWPGSYYTTPELISRFWGSFNGALNSAILGRN